MLLNLLGEHIKLFESYTAKLISEISGASEVWDDSKFSELSSSTTDIVVLSTEVITSARNFYDSLKKFEDFMECPNTYP